MVPVENMYVDRRFYGDKPVTQIGVSYSTLLFEDVFHPKMVLAISIFL